MFKTIAVLSMMLIFLGAASAQDTEPAPQIEYWEQVAGHWVSTEQQRATPDSEWEDVSSEWDIGFMPGGFFVEITGSATLRDGQVLSWIEVIGYDPGFDRTYSHYFNSEGSHSDVVIELAGQTAVAPWRETSADGSQQTGRCEWNHSSDFTSVEGTCERLTDGQWWTFRRVQGKKTE